MLHIHLKGRLGNNLFQIAAGASLAKAKGDAFCVSVPDKANDPGLSTSLSELRNLQKTILRKVEVREERITQEVTYSEKQFNYEPIPYQPEMSISGYFQSEKYFDKQLVRELFAIDEKTKKYILDKYGKILAQDVTSIHIRRGDYLKNIDVHPICSMGYFRRAIRMIGKKKPFLLVSNDIEWCKKQFKGENFYFAENESAVVDLYLQSLCKNNIISNSSFSWWGAWLNPNLEKKVLVPDPWFGISTKNMDASDLIPEGWIKVPNRMPVYLQTFAILRKAKRDLYHILKK
ncbi:alpha-1,2-fucosyltransferase [Parabacteroides sp. FAFU027]|uniref:alpha-1,2-fucosyltransferase n=1 Tax=Parabacteroides sp. FAFU027 TaxID=2922715 RepID=UPI001FAF4981|nr:alpha-1,2-fucosyltransferase [Parabacteroides sp. FAFU027]